MKNKFLQGIALAVLLLLCGCSAGGAANSNAASPSAEPKDRAADEYMVRYPQGGFYHWQEKDFQNIKVKDSNGDDISEIAIDLWYCANDIYNVDDRIMFLTKEQDVSLSEYPVPQSVELLNYQEVVENVFTTDGISQLEKTALDMEGNLLIRKVDGHVYRMAEYKSGFSFANALTAMETKEVTENRIELTVEYAVTGFIEDKNDPAYVEPKYFQVNFDIAKVDGNWLVDQYIHPDAVQ